MGARRQAAAKAAAEAEAFGAEVKVSGSSTGSGSGSGSNGKDRDDSSSLSVADGDDQTPDIIVGSASGVRDRNPKRVLTGSTRPVPNTHTAPSTPSAPRLPRFREDFVVLENVPHQTATAMHVDEVILPDAVEDEMLRRSGAMR